MCEHRKCRHNAQQLCSCVALKKKDFLALAIHVYENMTDVQWELDYTDLFQAEPRRLCRVGVCRDCGGRLCHEVDASNNMAGDDFLSAIYRHLYQLDTPDGTQMTNRDFREKFVQMFHEQDRPFLREWLARPENSHASGMYRRSVKASAPPEAPAGEMLVYTIVRTSVDAERGSFPSPMTEGSFLDIETARAELRRLVEKEKEEMEIHFDEELYRKEYDDDFWEAYQEGYAAAWFSRLEILPSELKTPKYEKEGV